MSDGMLTDGKTLLAVEVENRQTHPDTNVGKYWLLHEGYKAYDKTILFHIFTPLFDSYPWRMSLASFYAERMNEKMPLEYVQMDYRKGGSYEVALSTIKGAIEKRILVEFGTARD